MENCGTEALDLVRYRMKLAGKSISNAEGTNINLIRSFVAYRWDFSLKEAQSFWKARLLITLTVAMELRKAQQVQ